MSGQVKAAVRQLGTVKWYDAEDRGYGFITPDEPLASGRDIFVHASAVTRSNGLKRLEKGQRVSYEISEKNGRPVAVNIAVEASPS